MKTEDQIQQLLDFAIDIVTEAGDIALQYFRADITVMNKSQGTRFDPVTKADQEIEAYLRDKIAINYPGHSIIGEEYSARQGKDKCTWIIDPIDGTRGFVAGSPMWGILLGLMIEEKCVIGLMHQPFVKDTFVGSDAGAFLIRENNKKEIKTSDKKHISESILCSTHPSMFHTEGERQTFQRFVDATRFSRLGTDCYGYSLLAAGFIDIVVEGHLQSYDIMPLIQIVEAAGGIVTTWDGNTVENGGNIIASANDELHEQVLELIKLQTL